MLSKNSPSSVRPSGARRAGFSLVELLVVLTIVSIVVGVLIPSLRAARISARVSASQSVIRDVASSSQRFRIDHRRDPGFFSAVEMGSVANQGAGFSAMQNVLLDLSGGVVGGTGGGIVNSVGPGTANGSVNVDPGLIGATNNAPATATNISSTGGYYTPDRKYFETVVGRVSNASNAQIPDLVDAFGQPILAWAQDPRKGSRFVAINSGNEPARFYWASNATYLSSSALGRELRNQQFISSNEVGSLIGAAGGGGTPPGHAVTADGTRGSLAVMLANAGFPTVISSTDLRPGEPRGTLVFHSAGRDGVFLGTQDAGARKWAMTGAGVDANGLRMGPDGTDVMIDFDDIVQPVNN